MNSKTVLPIGISSSCIQNVTRGLMEEYREAGISHMEISVPPQILSELDFAGTARDAAACGIRLWSLHLPFYPADKANISDPDPDIRGYAVRSHAEYIRRAGAIGIGAVVVHPSCGPIAKGTNRGERIRLAQDSLAHLCDVAEAAGTTLAAENMIRTGLGNRSEEMLVLLSADDRLRLTFDSNHPLYEDPCDFIKPLLPRLATIHVSDYDGLNERHWMPGEGIIRWDRLHNVLTDGGYTGPWMYEVRYEPPKTIERRILTAADYRRNAEAIFAGRIPAPLGSPIESVCYEKRFLDVRAWNE